MRTVFLALAAVAALGACDDDDDSVGPSQGSVVQDRRGDFLPGYTGPRNGDVDVLRAEAVYDGASIVLTSTSAAAVGTTPDAVFIWGIDRGAGTARFGDLANGIHFDAVVSVQPSGTALVRDLITNTSQELASANISITGAEIRVVVPAAALPSRGLSLGRYTANLWPRVGTGNNATQIADFAPDNSNIQVGTVTR